MLLHTFLIHPQTLERDTLPSPCVATGLPPLLELSPAVTTNVGSLGLLPDTFAGKLRVSLTSYFSIVFLGGCFRFVQVWPWSMIPCFRFAPSHGFDCLFVLIFIRIFFLNIYVEVLLMLGCLLQFYK